MVSRNVFLRKVELKLRNIFEKQDPEVSILRKICIGKGADIGCGNRKVCDSAIGVDLVAFGDLGEFGSQKNKASKAEIASPGDKLPFKNNELDYLVAKHNLEHYEDPLKTISEWKRVVKKNGKIGVVVPDDLSVHSIKLDPTHKVTFDLESLEELFKKADLKILEKGKSRKNWSIYLIAQK